MSDNTMKRSLILVLVLLVGCSNKNPGTLSKSEVEAELKGMLRLKEVSLTETPDGGYTGTGTAGDGTKYELTVTQDAKVKQLNYKAKDKQGGVLSGFIKHY